MQMLKTITLTHANNKAPIEISKELLFAYYISPAHKSTYLVASGGAIIPVSESPEEITNKLQGEGQTNGKN